MLSRSHAFILEDKVSKDEKKPQREKDLLYKTQPHDQAITIFNLFSGLNSCASPAHSDVTILSLANLKPAYI